jgi:hypothetical protein
MSIEQWWNDTERGKSEVLGEKTVPVPFCPTKIPHGLTSDRIRPSAVTDQLVTTRAMARERVRERERETAPKRGRGERASFN